MLAALAAIVEGVVHYGGPVDVVRRGYDSFHAKSNPGTTNLNKRFFTLSSHGRVRLWRTALDQYEHHPVLGAGAGTFDRFWLRDRNAAFIAHDAHNLYLETLAELGPVGLGLLAAFLLVPFYAVARHRNALSAGAFAAFAADAARVEPVEDAASRRRAGAERHGDGGVHREDADERADGGGDEGREVGKEVPPLDVEVEAQKTLARGVGARCGPLRAGHLRREHCAALDALVRAAPGGRGRVVPPARGTAAGAHPAGSRPPPGRR